ncbi:hypothetical protein A2U01_0089064, partial [Trifolium medium]|nr:hypothetical protein [Trifolium medium]
DPGGTRLVTTSPLPEPLDWTHGTVAITPPPPEPPDCKYTAMIGTACQ